MWQEMKPETVCPVYLYMSCDLVPENLKYLHPICRRFSSFLPFTAKIRVWESRKNVKKATQAIKFHGESFKMGLETQKLQEIRFHVRRYLSPISVTWSPHITQLHFFIAHDITHDIYLSPQRGGASIRHPDTRHPVKSCLVFGLILSFKLVKPVQKLNVIYPQPVQNLPTTCPDPVPKLSQTRRKPVQNLSNTGPKLVPIPSKTCPKPVHNLCKICAEPVLDLTLTCPLKVDGVTRVRRPCLLLLSWGTVCNEQSLILKTYTVMIY